MTVTTWKLVGSEIGCLTNLIIARLYGLAKGLCHWREGIFTPMDRMDRMGFYGMDKGDGRGYWIPACAGMTVGGVGMTVGGADDGSGADDGLGDGFRLAPE